MATDKPKFSVIVEEDTLQLIEDYRHIHKLRSKSAAAAELIEIGLRNVGLLEHQKE